VPAERPAAGVLDTIVRHRIQCLPATPTFLRMLLLSGALDSTDLSSLEVVTYGTERMDQGTLDALCRAMPRVDLRQTYGMSELGILRVKSRARDSLWMRVGGEGVELRVDAGGVLHIRAANRMLGYLNAPSPFADGWYNTGDIVEQDQGDIRVVGRTNEVINVGGVKVLPSEIERVALLLPQVVRAKASGAPNPITGQHIEVVCEPAPGAALTRDDLRAHFRAHLAEQCRPHRIRVGEVPFSHRFKRE
jgi:acyl-CoA synthetase (AMP-forming)/AMP-acid ligase II